MPYIATAHELKTKPMQHSVRELRAIGIQPHVLLCRTDRFLSPDIKAKLALFCDVPEEAVITAKDVETIYEVPLVLSGEGLDDDHPEAAAACASRGRDMTRLGGPRRAASRTRGARSSIGIVGKYVSFEDSYKSLNEALSHGGFGNDVRVVRRWVEAEELEAGERRGRSSRASTASWCPAASARAARAAWWRPPSTRGAPARPTSASATASSGRSPSTRATCAGSRGANSTEVDPNAGTRSSTSSRTCSASTTWAARCASAPTPASSSPARAPRAIYGATEIRERHRHRYEFNQAYESCLDGQAGS